MELDPQVEETLPTDSPNPEHKQKRKHKHKHKHHKDKRTKRDRHTHTENGLASVASDDLASLNQVLAPAGIEDGELPGPPVVEQTNSAGIQSLGTTSILGQEAASTPVVLSVQQEVDGHRSVTSSS